VYVVAWTGQVDLGFHAVGDNEVLGPALSRMSL
jgi:hypothetical protein